VTGKVPLVYFWLVTRRMHSITSSSLSISSPGTVVSRPLAVVHFGTCLRQFIDSLGSGWIGRLNEDFYHGGWRVRTSPENRDRLSICDRLTDVRRRYPALGVGA
jgi:hypothetical protein